MPRVARLLREQPLTAEDIAARSHLPHQRVRELLDGAEPSMAELRALSKGLRIPLYAFSRGHTLSFGQYDRRTLFRATEQTGTFQPPIEYIADYVISATQLLPKRTSIPEWLRHFSVKDETYLEAHRLANLFREIFYSTRIDEPILDLPVLLSTNGFTHISMLRKSRYEGASVAVDGYAFIFISPRFQGRMLFTLAHELGHIVAHHTGQAFAIYERASQIGSPTTTSRSERFVDAFASVLLVPDRGVGKFLQTTRRTLGLKSRELGDIEILLMARYFGVSFDVAARRCEDLGLVPKGGSYAMSRVLKKNYGSPEKRADDAGLPPRPNIEFPKISSSLLSVVVEGISAGNISTGWATSKFGLSVGELYFEHAKLRRGLHN